MKRFMKHRNKVTNVLSLYVLGGRTANSSNRGTCNLKNGGSKQVENCIRTKTDPILMVQGKKIAYLYQYSPNPIHEIGKCGATCQFFIQKKSLKRSMVPMYEFVLRIVFFSLLLKRK